MSLSGAQLTRIGPIQVSHAYLDFVAKETATAIVLGQGGTFILLEATPRVLAISTTPTLIDIDSDRTVVYL